jgi:DNA recombination-dependent growth factor C
VDWETQFPFVFKISDEFRIKQVNFTESTHVPTEHSEEDDIQAPVESSHSVSFGVKQE